MNTQEAISIFNITDIFDEDTQSIKKRYKKLALEYHPDSKNGSTELMAKLNDAHKILNSTIKKVEQFNKINSRNQMNSILIPLESLIKIYSGESVTAYSHGDKKVSKTINRETLKNNNIIIGIDIGIENRGVLNVYNELQPLSEINNYTVNLDLFVDNIFDTENITIKILDYNKTIKVSSQSIRIKINMHDSVYVTLVIEKKLKTKGN